MFFIKSSKITWNYIGGWILHQYNLVMLILLLLCLRITRNRFPNYLFILKSILLIHNKDNTVRKTLNNDIGNMCYCKWSCFVKIFSKQDYLLGLFVFVVIFNLYYLCYCIRYSFLSLMYVVCNIVCLLVLIRVCR